MAFVSIITLFGLGLVAAILLFIASRVLRCQGRPAGGGRAGGPARGQLRAVAALPAAKATPRPWSPIPTSRPTNAVPAVPIRPSPGELTGKTVAEAGAPVLAAALAAGRQRWPCATSTRACPPARRRPCCAAAPIPATGPAWASATACRSAPSTPCRSRTAWCAWTCPPHGLRHVRVGLPARSAGAGAAPPSAVFAIRATSCVP